MLLLVFHLLLSCLEPHLLEITGFCDRDLWVVLLLSQKIQDCFSKHPDPGSCFLFAPTIQVQASKHVILPQVIEDPNGTTLLHPAWTSPSPAQCHSLWGERLSLWDYTALLGDERSWLNIQVLQVLQLLACCINLRWQQYHRFSDHACF